MGCIDQRHKKLSSGRCPSFMAFMEMEGVKFHIPSPRPGNPLRRGTIFFHACIISGFSEDGWNSVDEANSLLIFLTLESC